jgi:hypothetical protein
MWYKLRRLRFPVFFLLVMSSTKEITDHICRPLWLLIISESDTLLKQLDQEAEAFSITFVVLPQKTISPCKANVMQACMPYTAKNDIIRDVAAAANEIRSLVGLGNEVRIVFPTSESMAGFSYELLPTCKT